MTVVPPTLSVVDDPIRLFSALTVPVIPVVPLPHVAAPTFAGPLGMSQFVDLTT